MKKLILLALPLLLVACGTNKILPVEVSTESQIQPIIVPAGEIQETEKDEEITQKPQKEILAKPEPAAPRKTEPEPTPDEMTNEIDAMIDDLISDL